MVNMPCFVGSPDRTASLAPGGRLGGAGPHLRPAGLTCAGAALPASKADKPIKSARVITFLLFFRKTVHQLPRRRDPRKAALEAQSPTQRTQSARKLLRMLN